MSVGVLLSVMLLATPAGDRIPSLTPSARAGYVEHPAADHLGVDANEIRLKIFGGYGGETLTAVKLKAAMRLGPSTLYADRHGHLYADRDGDGVIDAGALYNAAIGNISADWNCDGVGDQVLADIKP